MQQVNARGVYIIDVKPDNWMYKYNDITRAGNIVMIDLGTAVMRSKMIQREYDEGTPVFVSHRIFERIPPTGADDLEGFSHSMLFLGNGCFWFTFGKDKRFQDIYESKKYVINAVSSFQLINLSKSVHNDFVVKLKTFNFLIELLRLVNI